MPAIERHYSVQELAKLWNFCENTIRSLFRDEPGVLKIGSGETLHKRKKWQLSIPESVVIRVHRKRSKH